jgi:hypothetical protein
VAVRPVALSTSRKHGTGLSAKPSALLSGLKPTRPAGGRGHVNALKAVMPRFRVAAARFHVIEVLFRYRRERV